MIINAFVDKKTYQHIRAKTHNYTNCDYSYTDMYYVYNYVHMDLVIFTQQIPIVAIDTMHMDNYCQSILIPTWIL